MYYNAKGDTLIKLEEIHLILNVQSSFGDRKIPVRHLHLRFGI